MIGLFILLSCAIAVGRAAKVDSITTSVTSDGYVFVRVDAGGHSGWGQASYNNEHADLMYVIADKVHEWVGPQVLVPALLQRLHGHSTSHCTACVTSCRGPCSSRAVLHWC